ncbi:hypothetical protein [Deinococcus soli (ex Cha et al. 2016)]|uniref:Uncharacterized protein n=1 Tax=Deinococcus soli (ex Cha et al. 2016) TaxID=1309411 RepID=A0ACC6KPL5_9DEIO|nr:hypothetical protein [Deinococcus soli (ex Cha et al. 2016)]MDR6330612.1 hypothetical protein [Deinococcus soli (ex Cha et al. 2016)]MDR6754389.1 hypothetical protein [Deinococcus soli (ex Cha et al. 2016)]
MRIVTSAKLLPAHLTLPTLSPVPFDHAAVRALRPMLGRILGRYGLNIDSSSRLDIADALRDSGARRELHPHPPLHPAGSTAGLMSVPPASRNWGTLNTLWSGQRAVDDNTWWAGLGYDYLTRWQKMYGTLNTATGALAADGMMQEVESGWWQVRDVASYRTIQCTHQHFHSILESAAVGIPELLVNTIGHDTKVSFIAELNRWIMQCRTYNETYVHALTGERLTPLQVHEMSISGQRHLIRTVKRAGPDYDPGTYIPANPATDSMYFSDVAHAGGMSVMGTFQINNFLGVPVAAQRPRSVQLATGDLPNQAPFNNAASFPRALADRVFPHLGVGFIRVQEQAGGGVSFGLGVFNWPGAGPYAFQKRVNGGAWADHALDGDFLARGAGRVDYRARDSLGFYTGWATIDV